MASTIRDALQTPVQIAIQVSCRQNTTTAMGCVLYDGDAENLYNND
jgi:hypothetical protein